MPWQPSESPTGHLHVSLAKQTLEDYVNWLFRNTLYRDFEEVLLELALYKYLFLKADYTTEPTLSDDLL